MKQAIKISTVAALIALSTTVFAQDAVKAAHQEMSQAQSTGTKIEKATQHNDSKKSGHVKQKAKHDKKAAHKEKAM